MDQKSSVYVTFFTEAMPDGALSRDAGRQVYKEVEMVKVITLGDKDNNWIAPAHDPFTIDRKRGGHMSPAQRWPEQYAAFKAGLAEMTVGTPLEHMGFLGKAQIADLQYNGVKTAEQLADLPEAAAAKGFGWRDLREQAKVWLSDADKNAMAAKAQAERDAANERADDLAARLAEMEAKLAALDAPKRGKSEAA
jgi:hypothetical protein